MDSISSCDAAGIVNAAVTAGAGAGGSAPALWLDLHRRPKACAPSAGPLTALPLGRIERLDTGQRTMDLLPQLFEPAAAAALTALRALDIMALDDAPEPPARGTPWLGGAATGPPDRARLGPAVWRAPWMAQLTRLELYCDCVTARYFSGALAPGSLPALQELRCEAIDLALTEPQLGALVGACSPAALRSLAFFGAHLSDLARLAEGLTGLNELHLLSASEDLQVWSRHIDGGVAAAEYAALQGARLAPLARLSLRAGKWLFAQRARLEALLAAPWAAALRELTLIDVNGYSGHLQMLGALSALQHLHTLRFRRASFGSAALIKKAAADGSAAAWAPRIKALELCSCDFYGEKDLLALLQALPLERLERLSIRGAGVSLPMSGDALQELMAECVRVMPTLKSFEYSGV